MRAYRLLVVVATVLSACCAAENLATPSRIPGPIDESKLIALKGNTHRRALARFDVGNAPADLPMQRMVLVLKRSAEQNEELSQLLHDLQDQSSPQYHHWLTPAQFGRRFGPSDDDLQKVSGWLHAHGFVVENIAAGKQTIEFSGTAAQVQEAFHTAIHKFRSQNEEHWANSSDPQIPAALAPVVAGVATLHNFYKKPLVRITAKEIVAKYVPGQKPVVTFSSTPAFYALGPADFATIYNINPLRQQQPTIDGTGSAIAVVGRTEFNLGDIDQFKTTFGVYPSLQPRITLNGPDPGNLGGSEEVEALLDTTWSSSIAPDAFVNFVASASTNTTDGVDLSTTYIVDHNLADIMTESFGSCEADATSAEITFHSQVSEQAAAQGITYIVAAGDTGSAGCDPSDETRATGPLSVSVIASSPFDVAVGGTQFNDVSNPAAYWSVSNNQYNLGSAMSYIPENVWNESCTAGNCNGLSPNILATGGGASTLYSKPEWQTGVPGIPADGARDVPDVSFAAAGHTPYLLCFEGSCIPDSQGFIRFLAVEGTSASAPSFAGILALAHQAIKGTNGGEQGRLGQINYVLYRLAAAANFSKCNGSSVGTPPANTCVFNDVTAGNNDVPGEVGYGGSSPRYASTTGYDLASGLGSVNATNLVNKWNSIGFNATNTTLTLNPSSPTQVTHGSPVSVQIGVTPAHGSGIPTGDVSIYQSGESGGVLVPLDLYYHLDSTGSVSATTNALPGGFYGLSAHYAGDKTFAASNSPLSTPMDVVPEPSNTAVSALTLDSHNNFVPLVSALYGSYVYVRADVTGQSGFGTATGQVTITDNGAMIPSNPYFLNSEGNTATPNGIFIFGVGTHSIVGSYAGDLSFDPSTSPPAGFTITQAPTTDTLEASSKLIGSQSAVVLTATIGTNGNGVPPGGVVQFFNGANLLGSARNIGSINVTTGKKQATATYGASQLPLGDNSITAHYAGDPHYIGSNSAAFVVTVVPDFSVKLSSTSLLLPGSGGSANATITIQGATGYKATVNFGPQSCINLPPGLTCNFSPSSISGSGTTTLTIASSGLASGAAPLHRRQLWIAGSPVLAAIVMFCLPGEFRRRRSALFVASLLIVLGSLGCGGGNSSGSSNSVSTPVPAGTYPVVVQATAEGLTRSAKFTLTVQ